MNTLQAVKEVCESLGYEVRSYSGRNMYGRECLGIEVPHGTSATKVAFRLGAELESLGEDGAIEDLSEFEWCQDSLGMDSIVYIPGLRWEVEAEEEEDADTMLSRQNEEEKGNRELGF